jgi:hypothetical protein
MLICCHKSLLEFGQKLAFGLFCRLRVFGNHCIIFGRPNWAVASEMVPVSDLKNIMVTMAADSAAQAKPLTCGARLAAENHLVMVALWVGAFIAFD